MTGDFSSHPRQWKKVTLIFAGKIPLMIFQIIAQITTPKGKIYIWNDLISNELYFFHFVFSSHFHILIYFLIDYRILSYILIKLDHLFIMSFFFILYKKHHIYQQMISESRSENIIYFSVSNVSTMIFVSAAYFSEC